MKKSLIAVSVSFALLNMSGIVQAAGDINAGRTKAASCASCHGGIGNSMMPLFPKLAAQNEGYLVKQMKAFRDGTREDPMMSPMAKPLSDTDIENLAAYYSTL